MMTIRIIKDGYGRKAGQVVTVTEFDGGHLMAFGFAVPYVEDKRQTAVVAQPETRTEPSSKTEQKIIHPIEQPVSFFKRRGRPKK
jgi:hypothetical protein